MGQQGEQNSRIEKERCETLTTSVQPVSIQRKDTPIYSQSQQQPPQQLIKQSGTDSPIDSANKLQQLNDRRNNSRSLDDMTPITAQVYDQHKRFLERYKRQRQQQLKAFRSRRKKQQELKEQSNESDYEEKQQEEDVLRQFLGEKMEQIHTRIQRQLLNQRCDEDRPKYKLFMEVVQTKNDIQRVQKEKRFIKSQLCKHIEYHEPQMPSNYKPPLEYRVKSQSFQDEIELSRRAKDFVQRIQKEHQNLLGKHILRKKREESKRKYEEKERVRQQEQVKQIEKQQRKLKAQQNLLLLKEKMRINKIVSKQSLEELRQMLIEKQKKLQEVRESLKHKDTNHRGMPHNGKGAMAKSKKRVKTSINQYTSYQEHAHIPKPSGTVQEFTKNHQLKSTDTGIRAKIAIKRHRLSKPAECVENASERQNEFLDRYLQLPRKVNDRRVKGEKRQLTTQIAQYPKSELSEYNDKETAQSDVAAGQQIYTQYLDTEEKESDFFMPKLQLKSHKEQAYDLN